MHFDVDFLVLVIQCCWQGLSLMSKPTPPHPPPTLHSTNEPTKDRLILTIIPCCIIRPNVHRHWTIVVVPHSVWRWKCVCTSHLLPTQVRKNLLFSVFSNSTREKEKKKRKIIFNKVYFSTFSWTPSNDPLLLHKEF